MLKPFESAMNFESLKQIFKFEVSRFPFLPPERQKSLRRAYRTLEATLRKSIRELEFGWWDTRYWPPRLLSARLNELTLELRGVCAEYGGLLSAEMRNGLESLCEHLRKLKEAVSSSTFGQDQEIVPLLKELIQGLEELKKALGVVHRL